MLNNMIRLALLLETERIAYTYMNMYELVRIPPPHPLTNKIKYKTN